MSYPSPHGESGQAFLFINKLETVRFNATSASGANVTFLVEEAVAAIGATAEVTASITETANMSASFVLVSVFFISSLTAEGELLYSALNMRYYDWYLAHSGVYCRPFAVL